MVTEPVYMKDGKYMSAQTFYGLSTDTKPTSCGNGSIFIAVDNIGKEDAVVAYCFDAENGAWYPAEESDGEG